MTVFKTQTRVRYAETDATGIVYYANYFIYFELGRLEMFRELDLPYDRRLPIAETYCRYHASACFDDQLEIHTSLEEVRSRGFRLGAKVFRLGGEEPELLVDGYTAMVTADGEGNPIDMPKRFKAAFEGVS